VYHATQNGSQDVVVRLGFFISTISAHSAVSKNSEGYPHTRIHVTLTAVFAYGKE